MAYESSVSLADFDGRVRPATLLADTGVPCASPMTKAAITPASMAAIPQIISVTGLESTYLPRRIVDIASGRQFPICGVIPEDKSSRLLSDDKSQRAQNPGRFLSVRCKRGIFRDDF